MITNSRRSSGLIPSPIVLVSSRLINKSLVRFHLLISAMPHGLWDLSSLTRDGSWAFGRKGVES